MPELLIEMTNEGGFGRSYGSIQDGERGVPKYFALWSSNEAEDFSVSSLVYRVRTLIYLDISGNI
jgi:hypothetical protein